MKYILIALVLLQFTCACSDQEAGQAFSESKTESIDSIKSAPTPGRAQQPVVDLTETGEDEAPDGLESTNFVDTGVLSQRWTGDLDEMEKQRVIRVLTVYGLGRYFLDGPQEKGLTFEMFKMFETFINKQLGRKTMKVHVVFIPVARDELIPGLIEGRGDIAAAALTITSERDSLVDFTTPVSRPLSEILVTGPSAPGIKTIEDLAGHSIFVRASSSYYASLQKLNTRFREAGLEEIQLDDATEILEDEDILEMVNAGLIPFAVVDDYKADIWAGVFPGLVVRKDIVFREGGQIAYAVRENSPQLLDALKEFNRSHRQGTLNGNILIKRWLDNYNWAENSLAAGDYQRFQDVVDIFQQYGERYGVDYLMVAAQGYQESRLDQSARSRAGAIGIMQLLPSTASDSNVGISDISTADANIHAGIKYLDFIRNRYFNDPEMDRFNQTLFAFAAYNAGPARVRKLRNKAEKQGYDPNVWFDNVEVIAAKDIGQETVQYVANILKYYIAYRLSAQQQVERAEQRRKSGVE